MYFRRQDYQYAQITDTNINIVKHFNDVFHPVSISPHPPCFHRSNLQLNSIRWNRSYQIKEGKKRIINIYSKFRIDIPFYIYHSISDERYMYMKYEYSIHCTHSQASSKQCINRKEEANEEEEEKWCSLNNINRYQCFRKTGMLLSYVRVCWT